MRHVSSTFDLDARLRAIAAPQLGLVTVSQAARSGIDKHALARRRETGALVPVFPNVMRLAAMAASPLQRVLAASFAVPDSVITATSSARVSQMPVLLGASHDVTPVLGVETGRVVRIPGITTIRQSVAMPTTRWMTSRMSNPASTLLLLPRFVDDDTVERCLDHCLANRLTTVRAIRTLIDRLPAQSIHGRRLLLGLLDDRSSGIGHRSRNEQKVGRWLIDAGLAQWKKNHGVRVREDESVEVDFAWPDIRVALEVSPFFTHGSRAKQERDADRRRLLVLAGWRVLEALDDDIAHESAFGRTIAALRTLGAG